jgi:transcriptional regulator with XRE-family HTH domain
MPICLGRAAQDLRSQLGLSLRQAAVELGISYAYLCNVENGKSSPSPEVIEKFHDAWGVDLYMYAVAFHSEERKVPHGLQGPLRVLAKGWKRHIKEVLRQRNKDIAGSCLISVD